MVSHPRSQTLKGPFHNILSTIFSSYSTHKFILNMFNILRRNERWCPILPIYHIFSFFTYFHPGLDLQVVISAKLLCLHFMPGSSLILAHSVFFLFLSSSYKILLEWMKWNHVNWGHYSIMTSNFKWDFSDILQSFGSLMSTTFGPS